VAGCAAQFSKHCLAITWVTYGCSGRVLAKLLIFSCFFMETMLLRRPHFIILQKIVTRATACAIIYHQKMAQADNFNGSESMTDNLAASTKNAVPVTYQYYANHLRTTLVSISFSVFSAMCVASLALGIYLFSLLSKVDGPLSEEAKDRLAYVSNIYDGFLAWTSMCFLICAVIFLFWLFRANKNSHAIYPEKKFEFTPGWAVGSYFIPALSLFWPYKVMKEMWIANVVKSTDKRHALLLIWWFAFLLTNLIPNVASKMTVESLPQMKVYVVVNMFSGIFGMLSALIAIKLVRGIDRVQG